MGLSNSLHGEKEWVLDKEWECQECLGKNAYLALHLYFKKKHRRKKVQIMIFEIKVKEVDSFSSKALQPTICRKTFL